MDGHPGHNQRELDLITMASSVILLQVFDRFASQDYRSFNWKCFVWKSSLYVCFENCGKQDP